jgi:hypothetical protein
VPSAEREHGDRGGRIRADSGQRQELVAGGGDDTAMTFGDDPGSLMQSQGAPRIAEPPPLAYCLAWRVAGERGWRWPPIEPSPVRRDDPAHRRLLQHDLADQD